MIKLEKIEEPSVLVTNAQEWKTLYLAYQNGDKTISKTIKSKYNHKEIKELLVRETNGKCAYCESKILHISFGDIEHILPKSVMPQKCFEWGNLTLACTICNNNKRNYYEEENGMIDPYIDSPEEHFYFAGPMIIERTQRAIVTNMKLGLNRTELFEDRTRYLESLSGFTRQIQNTTDILFRDLLLSDLRNRTQPHQEYSKMVTDFVNLLELNIKISETS